ncbi:uncharacterized protein PV06_00436 [Exophiala oligosperma]|uniref:Uncharacterized protein n=2 Tax=Chaetothyriales TaxID=34395 RepID=A0A0D2DXE0_9EURO|nr:uncharacterized protein PV06_00436 [Exophiala oligosperma]KAJ9634262.1 hypothetical protein H2204_006339 [Knufia peltigerae]KIW47773.1 hypothetical protein PV06_00436 [Exophiala oligosperma]
MPSIKSVPPPRPSRPASVFSASSIDTLVADQGYRGFSSREAYLQALHEWAEEKKYYQSTEQLHGFYGRKTVDEILGNQGGKAPTSRRATVARLDTVQEGRTVQVVDAPAKESTGNRLKKAFNRRKSTA